MTELQAALYTRPADPIEVSATTSGRPSPGTEMRISAESEMQVRGAPLFAGYFDNERGQPRGVHQRRLVPQRRPRPDGRRGNVAITGRTKDVINRGGVKFNPAEVEVLLDSHPKILQSAIVPMPDPVLGEKACAFVTLKSRV